MGLLKRLNATAYFTNFVDQKWWKSMNKFLKNVAKLALALVFFSLSKAANQATVSPLDRLFQWLCFETNTGICWNFILC